MSAKYRIPITAITVFGTSSLLAITVATVLYLGFSQAAESTLKQLAGKASTLIDSMELSIDAHLAPIRDQARWVADDVKDLSNPASLDEYIFGSLAATPQVAGVAIITPDGNSRRWHRDNRVVIDEDWSHSPWIQEYLKQVKSAQSPTWREPIFSDTVNSSTLLHDIPLHDVNGEFIGVFAQIVTLQELSTYLSRKYAETGITPFVLYNREFVLAHPAINVGSEQQPLSKLGEISDLVLQRIWSPDETDPFIASELVNTSASGIFWGDNFYLYLHRDIDHYGPAPWTVGAYVNTSLRSRLVVTPSSTQDSPSAFSTKKRRRNRSHCGKRWRPPPPKKEPTCSASRSRKPRAVPGKTTNEVSGRVPGSSRCRQARGRDPCPGHPSLDHHGNMWWSDPFDHAERPGPDAAETG